MNVKKINSKQNTFGAKLIINDPSHKLQFNEAEIEEIKLLFQNKTENYKGTLKYNVDTDKFFCTAKDRKLGIFKTGKKYKLDVLSLDAEELADKMRKVYIRLRNLGKGEVVLKKTELQQKIQQGLYSDILDIKDKNLI